VGQEEERNKWGREVTCGTGGGEKQEGQEDVKEK